MQSGDLYDTRMEDGIDDEGNTGHRRAADLSPLSGAVNGYC